MCAISCAGGSSKEPGHRPVPTCIAETNPITAWDQGLHKMRDRLKKLQAGANQIIAEFGAQRRPASILPANELQLRLERGSHFGRVLLREAAALTEFRWFGSCGSSGTEKP